MHGSRLNRESLGIPDEKARYFIEETQAGGVTGGEPGARFVGCGCGPRL